MRNLKPPLQPLADHPSPLIGQNWVTCISQPLTEEGCGITLPVAKAGRYGEGGHLAQHAWCRLGGRRGMVERQVVLRVCSPLLEPGNDGKT